MFDVVVGHSDDIDTQDAVVETLAACETGLGGRSPVAGLMYCGAEFDHQLALKLILERYPGLQLIGCTTDGEMSSCGGFTEDAITLTLFCSDTIRIHAGVGEGAGDTPHQAARDAVAMACQGLDGPPKLAVVMPDGLTASAYQVLDGFNAALGLGVPVVGGMSADRVGGDKASYSTYQFCGDKIYSDAVPTLIFSGPLVHSLGVESGWSPVGEKMTVTRAQGNVLFELDGRPASELYARYLGELTDENLSGLGSYPLAIYEDGVDRFYLRMARSVDPQTGAVALLGEVPEGAQVRITQAIRDEVISGVQRSVETAVADYPGTTPSVALTFSCTGRKIVLGTKTKEEARVAYAGFDSPIPMSGFYTFGEIGPVSDHTRARYHNTTFVTLLMGEA